MFVLWITSSFTTLALDVSRCCSWSISFSSFNAFAPWDNGLEIELEKLYERINELGYKIKLTKKAKDFLCVNGYDKKYGARPLKRTIQKHVEDLIATEILNSSINCGDTIYIDHLAKKTELTLKIKNTKESKISKK